LHKNFFENR